MEEKIIEQIKRYRQSPISFIKDIWKLTPQEVKPECKEIVDILVRNNQWQEIKAEHFNNFVKGKNITWQQWIILLMVEEAIKKGENILRKISVVSGHGIGKSAVLAWLTCWYLFCFLNAQVGATAPTSEQIHDVLWKEIAIWLDRMPSEIRNLYEWQAGYLRIKESPETWFARARTARKEAPEAIAGLHGDHVFIEVDEASGVDDAIYKSAEGSLTGENTLVILISNGTRNLGYFYDTHHTDKDNWQTLNLNSEESPIVEEGYISRMLEKYGRDSDEYKIRVLGQFPASEQMDDKGWIPLLTDNQIQQVSDGIPFIGRKMLGIDPSGEGDDTTRWVLRDNYQAKCIATEMTSNAKTVARKTYQLIKEYELDPEDVVIDNFGVGANVKSELLLLDPKMNVRAINWGEDADDKEVFLNKRAECHFRGKDWIMKGGAVIGDTMKRDILSIKYRNNIKGRRQIIDKPQLRQLLGRSPDIGDALFLTFYKEVNLEQNNFAANQPKLTDPFAAI